MALDNFIRKNLLNFLAAPGLQDFFRFGAKAVDELLDNPEDFATAPVRWGEVVPVLLKKLSHSDWRVYQVARDALVLRGTLVIPELSGHLHSCAEAGGRMWSIYCLYSIGRALAADSPELAAVSGALAEAAKNDSAPEVRASALGALSMLDRPEVGGVISGAFSDPSPVVLKIAADACGRRKLAGQLEHLVKLLDDDDALVREAALCALGLIGDAGAADAVCGQLKDPEWHIRWCAARALGRLWKEKCISPLDQACGDEHYMVVIAALEVLAENAPGAARPRLEEAFSHPRSEVRAAAGHLKGGE